MRRSLRLGVRTRLLLAVIGAVAIALVVGVAAFNIFLGQRLSASAVSLARAQAEAELSSLQIVGGRVVVPKSRDEGTRVGSPSWVFEGQTNLESPRVPASWSAAAAKLAGGPEHTIRVNESVRLYSIPVVDGGNRVGTVVAGVLLDPYDETATIAFVGSVVLAVALLTAVAVLTHWILGKALLPVSRMTDDAAAWSDHDLDQRFNQGEPYDELTQLAATLDALLERLSASLRYEQRFTAELSHELRTPLAKIAAESELALARPRTNESYRDSLGAVSRNAEQMTRTVEALVAAARQEAGLSRSTTDARHGVQLAVEGVRDDALSRGVELALTLPGGAVKVAVELDLLERIIHPLLDNALRYGSSRVTVDLSTSGQAAAVAIRDDGVGVSMAEVESIFAPGVRGDAAGDELRGAGLGLALARRLARSAGGEITADASREGGRFTLQLPLA